MDDLIRKVDVALGGPDTAERLSDAEQIVQSFTESPGGILENKDVLKNAANLKGLGVEAQFIGTTSGRPIEGTVQAGESEENEFEIHGEPDSSLKILKSEGKPKRRLAEFNGQFSPGRIGTCWLCSVN